ADAGIELIEREIERIVAAVEQRGERRRRRAVRIDVNQLRIGGQNEVRIADRVAGQLNNGVIIFELNADLMIRGTEDGDRIRTAQSGECDDTGGRVVIDRDLFRLELIRADVHRGADLARESAAALVRRQAVRSLRRV